MLDKAKGVEPGWNWRSTLTDFATISGVLAGFSVTFIALMLTKQTADINIMVPSLTFGRIAVLLFGVSSGLFIAAGEYFLQAKEFDIYAVPDRYLNLFRKDSNDEKDWEKREKSQTESLRRHEKTGRRFYNIAIFAVFIGLWFAITPYNIVIASIVAGVGIAIELSQYLR
jgi:1,4-dihydroxy-2-naphthoate octaprenyltransferase